MHFGWLHVERRIDVSVLSSPDFGQLDNLLKKKNSEEMKYMMQDDVRDDGWTCIDGRCSDCPKPPTERPPLECHRVYMRRFARSGTFNSRFRHLNSQRFSRSHSHFVLPVVPTHLVLLTRYHPMCPRAWISTGVFASGYMPN